MKLNKMFLLRELDFVLQSLIGKTRFACQCAA